MILEDVFCVPGCVRIEVYAIDMTVVSKASQKSRSTISASHFVRKMRGGGQSNLVQAEDGCHYVMKMAGNPQGLRVLFNEAFGSELMSSLGLPVPNWRAIHVTEQFIDANPQLWFEEASPVRRRPIAGLHFGSQFKCGGPREDVYEILPDHLLNRIENRHYFIGMLLFDLWANHSDARQALFVEDLDMKRFRAVFIDNGHLFGKDNIDEVVPAWRTMFVNREIYGHLDIDSILSTWASRIGAIDRTTLNSACLRIPLEWYDSQYVSKLTTTLLRRRSSLADHQALIKKCVEGQHDSAHAKLDQNDERLAQVQLRYPRLCVDANRRTWRRVCGPC